MGGGDYDTLAFAHVTIGFELCVLGTLRARPAYDGAAEAMIIIGFLCFVTTFLLLLFMRFGELKGSFAALVSATVLILVAALFIVIGFALWCDEYGDSTNAYSATILLTSALMAIIGGVFFILQLVGGSSKTSPGPA